MVLLELGVLIKQNNMQLMVPLDTCVEGIHPEGQLWEALQLTPATVPASASVIERLAAKQLAGADLTTWLRLDAARASAREFWESFYGAIHDNTLPVGFDRETPEADVDLLDHRPARDMNLWRLRAESFRALIEPLDIANFYRLRKSDAAPHYISSRPAIYTYLRQIKWYHEFQQHRMDGTRAREEPAFEESMAWAYAKDATLRPLEMSGAILASNRLDVHGSKEFGGWPNLTATAHLKNGNPYDHTTM